MNPWSIIGAAAALVMGVTLGIDNNPEADTWGLVPPSTAYSLPVEGGNPTTTTEAPRPVWTGPGCKQWADLAQQAGFAWDDLWIVLQVMELESACQPDAIGDLNKGHSFGLMQIHTPSWCKPNKYWPFGYLQTQGIINDCTDLLDPMLNLKAAWHIATHYGWEQWTTYRRISG